MPRISKDRIRAATQSIRILCLESDIFSRIYDGEIDSAMDLMWALREHRPMLDWEAADFADALASVKRPVRVTRVFA